jgi:hypothetical protein
VLPAAKTSKSAILTIELDLSSLQFLFIRISLRFGNVRPEAALLQPLLSQYFAFALLAVRVDDVQDRFVLGFQSGFLAPNSRAGRSSRATRTAGTFYLISSM